MENIKIATTQPRGGQILDGSLTDADFAAANKDGAVGTASLRTLGTGAQQACAGNDSRFPGVQIANTFFAGPISGSTAAPVFRIIVAADMPLFNVYPSNTSPQLHDLIPLFSVGAGNNQQTAVGTLLAMCMRGYIDGYIMAPNATTPLTKLDIGAGVCSNPSITQLFMGGGSTKSISATWASGSGNGGMLGAAVAASTTYHVFAIQKTSDLSIDYGFDPSINLVGGTHLPSGYNDYRRIGSIITDASSHILPFHQYGDEFWWDTSILDVNVTNPGTSAVTRTLTVPTGVKVCAIGTGITDDSGGARGYYSSLDLVDIAPGFATCVEDNFGGSVSDGAATFRVWTNTSGQIRSRSDFSGTGTVVKIRTRGWVDPRGQNQ